MELFSFNDFSLVNFAVKIRIPLSTTLILIIAFLTFAVTLISLPRIAYTFQATKAYNSALSLWQSAGPTAYTMVVANNSPTQPIGGWNTIRVQDGLVLDGQNPDCPDCTPADFASLTVEALFQRIEEQCLRDFPFQFCNVAYDEKLGYPRRLDTYPYNAAGVERPSITVDSVEVLEP